MTVNRNIHQFLTVSFFFSISLVSTEYVPVYIWDTSKSNEIVPALPRINHETFENIIQEKLDKKSFVVVFAEPNLSAEDFRAVDDSGKRVYSHIPNIKASKTYLPLVDDPVDVLKNIYGSEVTQTTIKDFDVNKIESPILVVDLDDVQDDENRNEILKRHDAAIGKIYEALRAKKSDVVAIYTSYHTSWITPEDLGLIRRTRNILQVTTRADEERHAWILPNFILFVRNTPYVMIGNERTNLTAFEANSTSNADSTTTTVTLSNQSTNNIEVIFRFSFSGGYWFLNSVEIRDPTGSTSIPVRDINAPEEFSFQCTNQIFAPRGQATRTLSLPGMQLQVFRTEGTRFGDPYYCVGFTTAPIWSGIFVTAILAMIMAVGLSMMLDIKTMDRFDDPKGKTIQINTSE